MRSSIIKLTFFSSPDQSDEESEDDTDDEVRR